MSATSEGLGGGSRLGGGEFVVEVIKVEVRFMVVAIVVVGVFVYVCVSIRQMRKLLRERALAVLYPPKRTYREPKGKRGSQEREREGRTSLLTV